MIYACCLEDASYEAADEAFHRLQESFFDWNEVRVTTVSELLENLHNLPEPAAAALRIKKNLQSLFETRYSFDLEDMVKMNQGKAIQELEKLGGMSKFVLAYVTQNALDGHAVLVSDSIMQVLLATEIVSESEASKGQTPGLERTITKSKGAEFSSCLHQLALLHAQSPNGKATRAIMKEAGAAEPKKSAPASKPAKSAKKSAAPETDDVASPKASPKKAPEKAASTPKKVVSQKAPAKKAAAKKEPAKKVASKKPASTATAKKSSKKAAPKRKPK